MTDPSPFAPDRLELRRVDGDAEPAVRERIAECEAVHPVTGPDDLDRRLRPPDRRCFALVRPEARSEPVIFTTVALMPAEPETLAEILAADRAPAALEDCTSAVFYSISKCLPELREVALGAVLLRRAMAALQEEQPQLTGFQTLSPMPGFRRWLIGEEDGEARVRTADAPTATRIAGHETHARRNARAKLAAGLAPSDAELRESAVTYLLGARRADGRVADPVARFHLGGGARLDDVLLAADPTPLGWDRSLGAMARYRYERQPV